MVEFILTAFGAALAGNLLLDGALGSSAALAVARRVDAARTLAAASAAVACVATPLALALEHLVLEPLRLGWLRTLALLLFVAIVTRGLQALALRRGATLAASCAPLVLANSAVLSVVLTTMDPASTHRGTLALALGAMVGYGFAIMLLATLDEALQLRPVPRAFRGLPVRLLTLGLLGLAIAGWVGAVAS